MNAKDILTKAAGHLDDRAKTYDAPKGERSIARTVLMFNTLTGHTLSETDGWQFMILLKLVRTRQGTFKADNFEDAAAYAALACESAAAKHNELAQASKAFQEMFGDGLLIQPESAQAKTMSKEQSDVHDKPSRKTAANGRKKAVQKTAAKRRAGRR